MISILEGITDEQLLDFAIQHTINADETSIVAEKIILNYIFRSRILADDNLDEDEIYYEYNRLLIEGFKQNLVRKGVVAYDFETGQLDLTDKGNSLNEQMCNDGEI
jgi:hypothetical protein